MFAKVETSLLLICVTYVLLAFGGDVFVDPEATDVHLVCSLSNPRWERENKTIEASTKGYKLIPENGTLIVNKVDKDFMGVYICIGDGNNASETTTLFVRPYVKQFEKSKNMIQDDPLQLECKGYGYPIPTVQWFTGGKELTPDDRITLKDTPAQSDSSRMINGTIRIVKMGFDDAGDYHCIANNDHGFNNATIKVNVKDKLAALWPFLGICAEVAILCTIIFFYERRRNKKMREEERAAATEEAERLNSNNETKATDDVRQRK